MTNAEFTKLERAITAGLLDTLKRDLREYAAGEIERYRRAVYIRDEWCCNEMARFAMDVWQAAKPKTGETFGSVAYQLRGRTVNYCPFCGVSFLAPRTKAKDEDGLR